MRSMSTALPTPRAQFSSTLVWPTICCTRNQKGSSLGRPGVVAPTVSGCHSPDIRLHQPHSKTVSATGPTVNQLVDHIACEIARAYEINTDPEVLRTDFKASDVSESPMRRQPDAIRRMQRTSRG